jgi:epsilon-lactone hydrolase
MRRQSRFVTLVLLIVIASYALDVRSQQSAGRPYAYIPETVSPEWQERLRSMEDPGKGPVAPAPHDPAVWKTVRKSLDDRTVPATQAALRLFAPLVNERILGNVPVLEITPKGWRKDKRLAVYTHHGAYTMFSARSTLSTSALFAHSTQLRVISIDYTPAPEGNWRTIPDQVVAVFKALKAQGYAMKNIVFFGDSAGGGLAAGATLKLRDEGTGMPGALVLWSPWADITETGDSYQTLKGADPMLSYSKGLKIAADAYAAPKDQKHPYVSPVYGDFKKGFPPTLIQVGTKEILLSTAVRLYQAIESAGGTAKLDVYEGMPHLFQHQLPQSPESQLAMRKVKQFVDRYLKR